MKTVSYYLLAMTVACSFIFVSCDDKDNEPVVAGGSTDELRGYEYSKLSPEKQKEKLEKDAQSFLSEIKGLENEKGATVLAEFNRLLERNEPERFYFSSSDDFLYEELYGQYSWNANLNKWDYKELDSQAVFVFPFKSEEAKIVVTASSSVTVEADGERVRIPKNTSVEIYAGSNKAGSVELSSEIAAGQKLPSKTALSYVVGEYVLSLQATRGTSNVITSTLKKGEKVLIDAYVDATGDADRLVSEEDPGNISGNVLIKVNAALAFTGKADITKFQEAESKANEEYEKVVNVDYEDGNWDKYYEMRAEAYNKYNLAVVEAFNDCFELYLVSLSDRTKIARLEKDVKTYSDSDYNEEVTVLEFGDSSKVEVDVYFGSGFEDFIEKFESFISHFE
jgi:hypothetical protein